MLQEQHSTDDNPHPQLSQHLEYIQCDDSARRTSGVGRISGSAFPVLSACSHIPSTAVDSFMLPHRCFAVPVLEADKLD
ncbi:hypothetical protein BJX63DRAFT_390446 [Aspergillus granulosus]|uniref:Uncharacterized protein n=1 Tax=Aspergillus granulosus TaxID=176169 RepID=A0ABR4HID9_9EURO